MGIIYSESHNAIGPGQNSCPTQSTHYLGNKETEAGTKTAQSECLGHSVDRALLPQSVQMGQEVDSVDQWEKRSVPQQFSVTQKLEMTQVQGKDKSI